MKRLLFILIFLLPLGVLGQNYHSNVEPQHKHTSNNGVDVDYYYYSDIDKTLTVVQSKCWSCGGTGLCSFCHGQRGFWMSFGYVPCAACGGMGICPQCKGTCCTRIESWSDGKGFY